jgi:hypothetical protein
MSNVIRTQRKNALRLALIAGWFRDIAIARGGTGHQRKPLTEKARNKRKARANMAKESRKQNRRVA